MARRKKEPQSAHRQAISKAAEQLFLKKGIDNTSMDEIARAAGYSKATLYVYFKNKEELIGFLVLASMRKLNDAICLALKKSQDTKKRYLEICNALVQYQEEYPFYFQAVLETINIDFETGNFLPEEKETFLVGEQINDLLAAFLEAGIAQGDIRSDIEIFPTIFSFWGMLSGLLQLATNKEEYIGQRMERNRMEFLTYGFEMLYQSIASCHTNIAD